MLLSAALLGFDTILIYLGVGVGSCYAARLVSNSRVWSDPCIPALLSGGNCSFVPLPWLGH